MSITKKIDQKSNEKRPYKSLKDMPDRHTIRLTSIPEDISEKIRKESIDNGISEVAVVNIILRKHYGPPKKSK